MRKAYLSWYPRWWILAEILVIYATPALGFLSAIQSFA